MSLKDKIKQASDLKLAPYHVDEWDCDIFIRSWKGTEKSKFSEWFDGKKHLGEVPARVCLLSIANEDGTRVYQDKDLTELLEKSSAVLDRISVEALKLNGLHTEAVDEAKNV